MKGDKMKNTTYNILNIRIAKVEKVLKLLAVKETASGFFANADTQQAINSLENNYALNIDEARLTYNVGFNRYNLAT
jgi:hypothetical protein